jgi:hypothetical protein
MENYRLTVSELCRRAYEIAQSKGWHDDDSRTPGDFISLFHSELSEGLEAFRDTGCDTKVWYQSDGKPEGMAVELADAVIRIADWFALKGLDLELLLIQKLSYNEGRPTRHGGKHL